ncbi:hypothetical protein Scep_012992 [Stephania cephalantha]|uniref:Uncharacterized protein n=1 Tax=Stephania cephalantha TaxID=152367 RepID=A0AAP0P837_9MAGN
MRDDDTVFVAENLVRVLNKIGLIHLEIVLLEKPCFKCNKGLLECVVKFAAKSNVESNIYTQ